MTSFFDEAAKHLSLYFVFNCCKTILGAGFIGYGVTLLAILPDEDSEDGDAKADGDSSSVTKPSNNDTNWLDILYNKYVRTSATIGFGILLAVPALASQIAMETMIPKFVLTDIGYDVAAENVREMLPDWIPRKKE